MAPEMSMGRAPIDCAIISIEWERGVTGFMQAPIILRNPRPGPGGHVPLGCLGMGRGSHLAPRPFRRLLGSELQI